MDTHRAILLVLRVLCGLLVFACLLCILDLGERPKAQLFELGHQDNLLLLRDDEFVVDDHLNETSLIVQPVQRPLQVI